MTLPYTGLRVLDISQGIAGPYCAHILWQQGADVIKVEPPAGDWIRSIGVSKGEHSAYGIQNSAGKKALALDARTTDGKKILYDMAMQADVIVQNFRPGVAQRLGVGYEELSKLKPELVYVSISGYGPDGPYADAPATDSVMQSDSGLMFSNQDEHGTPRRLGVLAADIMTGLYASQGAATALYQRLARKQGTHVEVSLFEACAAFQGMCFLEEAIAGKRPFGSVSAPNGVFETSDGKVSIVTVHTGHFHNICAAMGRDEWKTDPRFIDNHIRFENREVLREAMSQQLRLHSTEYWTALFKQHDVLHAVVRDYQGVLNHPQAIYLNLVQQLDQPGVGVLPYIGIPMHPHRRPVESSPRIGEHSIEILEQLGLTHETIEQLITSGVVKQAGR
ncbi:MAG: CoA transferase [Burkholderiaceae bacterium]|nr:CoA transferase [Burkholderiaceae bacterium]